MPPTKKRSLKKNGKGDAKGVPRKEASVHELTLENRWNLQFEKLNQYKEEHGDCNVPMGYPADPHLANWVTNQRRKHKQNKLATDRCKRLNEIGFRWTQNTSWEDQLGNLKEYKAEHGDCNVPREHPADPRLANWLYAQRRKHKQNKLTDYHIKRLDEIGFKWNVQVSPRWEDQFHKLQRYKEEHGDCNVPSIYPANPQFAKWVSDQRVDYETNNLSADQCERLNEIGFMWHVECRLEHQLQKLQKDKAVHGDYHSMLLRSKLSADCGEGLNKIGSSWPKLSEQGGLEDQLQKPQKYEEAHGDSNVPVLGNPQLAPLVSEQRIEYENSKLTDDQYQRFDEIGFRSLVSDHEGPSPAERLAAISLMAIAATRPIAENTAHDPEIDAGYTGGSYVAPELQDEA